LLVRLPLVLQQAIQQHIVPLTIALQELPVCTLALKPQFLKEGDGMLVVGKDRRSDAVQVEFIEGESEGEACCLVKVFLSLCSSCSHWASSASDLGWAGVVSYSRMKPASPYQQAKVGISLEVKADNRIRSPRRSLQRIMCSVLPRTVPFAPIVTPRDVTGAGHCHGPAIRIEVPPL